MRSLDRSMSRFLVTGVILLIVFAIAANFVIIAQALFSPLNVVEGDSMNPAIKDDDAVIITDVDADHLEIGDVVAFEDPEIGGQIIIHRIVSMENEDSGLVIETKGDANAHPDPYLTPANRLAGKVSVVLPHAGLFLNYLRTPSGFIICVVCPVFLLLLYLVSHWYLEKVEPGEGFFARNIICLR
ncbi:MAG: signal peptidase I [Actinobacteria bacterium]|nr:signal peptidase I [Actinomycetota bacterium]